MPMLTERLNQMGIEQKIFFFEQPTVNREVEITTDCPDAIALVDLVSEATNEVQLTSCEVNVTTSGVKRKSADMQDKIIKRTKLIQTDNDYCRTLPCTTACCELKFTNVGNRNRHLSSACVKLHRELNTVVDKAPR
jgi:hypothetical protein